MAIPSFILSLHLHPRYLAFFLSLPGFNNIISLFVYTYLPPLGSQSMLSKLHFASYVLAIFTLLTPCITYTQLPSTKDELNIRNKLALYAYAIDNKDFGLLETIFVPNVTAIYGETEAGKLKGVRDKDNCFLPCCGLVQRPSYQLTCANPRKNAIPNILLIDPNVYKIFTSYSSISRRHTIP